MAYLSSFNPFSRSTAPSSESTSQSTSAPSSSSRRDDQPPPQESTPPPPQSQSPPQPRIANSSKLLLAGVTFFALSALITRRSLRRRHQATIPPFYTTASYHRPPIIGAFEALEALNIATINVVSVAMLSVGGCMYGFGIETMDDLRRTVRGGLGVDGTGRSEQDLEEELEEWVVGVMERKERKDASETGEGKRKVDERGRERRL